MFTLRVDPALELRMLAEADAEALFALVDRDRAYLREWLPWLDENRSPADTRRFLRGAVEQQEANNGFQAGLWSGGRIVGVIGYPGIDWPNRLTGIGYWLSAAAQGQGLMTRACRALVNHAFDELKLNRVEIRCATGNCKSRAIPERLGFTVEGTARDAEWLYDRFVDLVVYSMLAREWPEARRGES